MSMVDSSPLNLTISHWNQSLRRALQIHLSSCSTCYHACKDIIMFFTTALERKWPSLIHFHVSSPSLALRLHWILPSTMPTYPLSEKKPFNWLLRWMLRCVPLADIIISGWPNNIKEVPHPLHPYWQHYESLTVEDGIVFHREAPIIPPSEKGECPWYLQQSYQALPKHSCLPMVVFLAWYQQGH